jgi:DNA mismatch repair protein MSH6
VLKHEAETDDKCTLGSENYDPRTLRVPNSAWDKFTPFEKQYWEIKSKHWDTVSYHGV